MNNSLQLYEKNKQIEEIIDKSVNPDTGEIDDAVWEEINALEMQRADIFQSVALANIESRVNVAAVDNEIKRLTDIKRQFKNRENSAKKFLQRHLYEGEKYEFPNCKISWRKSTKVVIDDLIVVNAFRTTYPDLVKTKYEIDKTAIKQMYKDNKTLPSGIEIKEENNIQIK